jgi:hypothetical protein
MAAALDDNGHAMHIALGGAFEDRRRELGIILGTARCDHCDRSNRLRPTMASTDSMSGVGCSNPSMESAARRTAW